MNKTELIEKLALDTGVTKKLAGEMVEAYHGIIANELAAGNDVAIIGFGTFSVKHREARTGRNPSTGQPMEFAASRSPAFKAGKTLKDAVAL
ncbi:MAG: HU family DNA-binding protein [Pseudomonas sp.]|nr:HU family DNA-binding protein [Pseudomonas sp.]